MQYSEDQIKYGFWIPSFYERFFGRTLTELKGYTNEKRIRIACTQLLIPDKEQKRILKEWVAAIPELPIDFLMISSHVPQKLLDAIGLNKRLKGLYLKWTRAKYVEPITEMSDLEHLYIGSGSSILDIRLINKLQNLKTLTIENTKKENDYAFLKNLKQLEILSIQGDMYSKLNITSMDSFIGHLTNLKVFTTVMVKCHNPKISEVVKLKKLKNLALPNEYSRKQYERLKEELPALKYDQEYYRELVRQNQA